MTKKAKVLIFFLLILLTLFFYLIFSSESVKKADNLGVQVKDKITAMPEENYQIKAKEIITAYDKLSRDNSFSLENTAELKNKLLALKGLPAKFKDVHVKLVLALDRMVDYLKQKNQQEKNSSQQLVNQLKANYSWLNN